MKKVYLIFLLAVLFMPLASDDFKIEIAMVKPLVFDVNLLEGTRLADMLLYPFIPIVDAHYFILDKDYLFNLGIGFRAATFFLVNAIIPDVALDVKFAAIIFRMQVGGGLYFANALTDVYYGLDPIFFPDINIYYMFNDWVKIGAGGILCYDPRSNTPFSSMPYAAYLGFSFIF